MLIDTHSHLNFAAFGNDKDEVIKKCLESNIWMINVGTNYLMSKKAVEIAEKYKKGVYSAIGLHPIDIPQEVFRGDRYRYLAQSKKVVAIGEIGLDFPSGYEDKQKEVFKKQLKLAQELDLPVIIHCRKAHNELLEILETEIKKYKIKGVVHCFTGKWIQAKRYLNMGFYLGFNGIIYKLSLNKIIKKTPLDRILIETDCPFLTPSVSVNQRLNQRKSAFVRNEPQNVKYIAQTIGEIKNKTFKEISKITTSNANRLFEI